MTRKVGGSNPLGGSIEDAFKKYARQLKHYAMRILGDEQIAEDIVQDTFLAYQLHFDAVDLTKSPAPWLFRVAYNRCMDLMRRRNHAPRLFGDIWLEDPVPPLVDCCREQRPDLAVQDEEDLQAMLTAVDELSEPFRETYRLCVIQGLGYADAGRILGCPEKTVSTRLFRARQRLRWLTDLVA